MLVSIAITGVCENQSSLHNTEDGTDKKAVSGSSCIGC